MNERMTLLVYEEDDLIKRLVFKNLNQAIDFKNGLQERGIKTKPLALVDVVKEEER